MQIKAGDKFGRLTVLCEAASPKYKKWWCRCDCGTEVAVMDGNLKRSTRSCGCLQKERAAATGAATAINLAGQKFGRLTAMSPDTTGKRRAWHCQCECGNTVSVITAHLTAGMTQSCGCLQSERAAEANTLRIKHGHARDDGRGGRATSPEYRSWKAMKERVRNPNAPNYHLYGGRGIRICERWLEADGFNNFLADMGPRPEGMTLNRIDNDGNYEPANCEWADPKAQAANRRQTPEYREAMKKNLDSGRNRMWSDPDLRARLVESRRRKKANG